MKMKPSVIEELSRTQSKSYHHMMWPNVGVFGYGYTKHLTSHNLYVILQPTQAVLL